MLLKCCTQYASKFGKLSSGSRTGKGQFCSNPKERQCQRMFKLPHSCTHLMSPKVMPKILQARLQQLVNCELLDVQAAFRKGRGTKGQIANIRWIIEKAIEFQKNIYFCFIDYIKAFDFVGRNKLWKILKEMRIPKHLSPVKSVCRSRSNTQKWTCNNGLVPNWKRKVSRLYIVTLLI